MRPGGGRRKGHDFERAVAAELREVFGEAHRGQQGGGAREPDVVCPKLPVWFECKRGRRTNIKAGLSQAVRDTDGRMPVVVCRDDGEEASVTLRWSDFLDLLERVYGGGE